jgi:hypothetical protein
MITLLLNDKVSTIIFLRLGLFLATDVEILFTLKNLANPHN